MMFLVDGGINHDVPEQLHQNLLGIIVPHRRTHGRLLEMKEYIFWRGTRGPVSPCTTHTRGSVKETTTKRGRRPSHSESKQKADKREQRNEPHLPQLCWTALIRHACLRRAASWQHERTLHPARL